MPGAVLIVGSDERFPASFRRLIPGTKVRYASEAVDTEGIGVDVVVVACPHPLSELEQIRVHPTLHDKPVVLVAPGRRLPNDVWHADDVWPLVRTGYELLEDLVARVQWLLAATHRRTFTVPDAALAIPAAS